MNDGVPDSQTTDYHRVLVLAGGGAKGAYAFGCLQAFRDHGIDFQAVSGTSVGALNALIWATDRLEDGAVLWQRLSFKTVYPSRFPEWLPTFAKWLMGITYVVLQLLWAALHLRPVPHAMLWRFILSILLIGVPIGFSLDVAALVTPQLLSSGGNMSPSLGRIALLSMALLFTGAGVHCLGLGSKATSLFPILLGTAWGAPVMILVELVIPNFSREHPIVGIIAFPLAMLLILGGPYMLVSRFMEGTVLSSAPLMATIREIIDAGKFHMPCFATTGCQKEAFDPDLGGWYTDDIDQDGCAKPWAAWEPVRHKKWVPHYHGIHAYGHDRAVQCCLASAALPLGIVSPVKIGDELHVDGGVIDNVPLFPLLEFRPSEVFVVLLESFPDDEAADGYARRLVEKCSELDRIRRVAEHPVPASSSGPVTDLPFISKNQPPTVIPAQEVAHLPKFVLFHPRKSLGSFLSGTMNFSGKYAEKIRCLGYEDTRRKLSSLGSPRR